MTDKLPFCELGLFRTSSLKAASAKAVRPHGSPDDVLEFFHEIPLALKGHHDQPDRLLGTIHQGPENQDPKGGTDPQRDLMRQL